jgi:hypothetical protein
LPRGEKEREASGSPAEKDYELATHTVKVKRTGALFDIAKVWDLEGATTPNVSIDKTFNKFAFARAAEKPQAFSRFQSVDFFNQQSQPNEMLRSVGFTLCISRFLNESLALLFSSFYFRYLAFLED